MQSNKKHLLTAENINHWQLESEDPVSCKDAPNDQRVGPKLDQKNAPGKNVDSGTALITSK